MDTEKKHKLVELRLFLIITKLISDNQSYIAFRYKLQLLDYLIERKKNTVTVSTNNIPFLKINNCC